MSERLTIISERVDDIPLLLAHLERMGLQPLLDKHFPAHGNWVGLGLGGVTVIWLTPILSQADHRLNHVAPWAAQRLHTLRGCTGQPGHPLDVSDDRLAAVLEALSDNTRWRAFESAWNRQLLRVYDLRAERVRLASTTASGSWTVTEDGRCQFGHSNDQRPDLPQVQVRLSALDPLGLPVATEVLPGQRADDPLYVPALTRVRDRLERRGLLYGGDGTMGAVETRAFLQAGGDFYLGPWSESQLPSAVLAHSLARVWTGEQALTPSSRLQATGQHALLAEGFERVAPRTAAVAGAPIPWTERRLVSRSQQLAQAGERALRTRLATAQAASAALNERRQGKRRCTALPALQEAVAASVARSHVQGLLQVRYAEQIHQRPVRRSGDRPATVRVAQERHVTASVAQEAVEAAVRPLGWRV
jgi:transposase